MKINTTRQATTIELEQQFELGSRTTTLDELEIQ
jgi:hypothetical protein